MVCIEMLPLYFRHCKTGKRKKQKLEERVVQSNMKLTILLVVVLIFIHFQVFGQQATITNVKKDNKDKAFKLPENYSKELRPSADGENSPTIIETNVHVQAINPIKAADMDFRIDMTLTQRWTDHRLQFAEEWFGNKDHLILPVEFTDQIWFSHPFVVNAKSTEVGQLTQKLIAVYIFRNHSVQFSVNVFATVACAMNYRYYPFDSQLCPMFLESFSFDESQVKYIWSESDAFTINPKLRMLQFEPRRPPRFAEASVPRFNEEKEFSQLIAYFHFDRLLGNHLIQTFAPCSLVVCLSWFSFWLELNALSARMSLLVTSILTLVTQFVGLKTDLPPVAYIKAVDIWMAGCMIWVFGALGEFVLVKVIFSLTEDAKFHYHEDYLEYQSRQTERDSMIPNSEVISRQQPHSDTLQVPPVHSQPGTVGENSENWHSGELINSLNNRLSQRRTSRHVSLAKLDNNRQANFDTVSVATTSSASLDKHLWRLKLPLQWNDQKTGKNVLLWKKIDNFCKWAFPLSFVIFCTIYWIILYIHSEVYTEMDHNVTSTNATT